MQPAFSRNSIKAFTLIEILVVMAIIGILAAILFPVFARVRENARRTSCASNMKQLSLSVMQYAMDNDGKLMAYWGWSSSPPGYTSDWNRFSPIEPYIKDWAVVFCPSAAGNYALLRDASAHGSAWAAQYGFPTDIGNGTVIAAVVNVGTEAAPYSNHPTTTSLDSVPNAALTALLGETNYGSETNANYLKYGHGGTAFGCYGTTLVPWLNRDRHLEGANYAYMDGHVKWLKKETVDRVYALQGVIGITEAQAGTVPIVFTWDK